VRADRRKWEDLKESLTTGYDPYVDPLGVGDAMPEILRRHNLWPNAEDTPKLRPSVEAYRAACLKLMRLLVRVVAIAIGEKEDFFEKKITYPIAGIRALYYPPQEAPGEEETGLGAHTDVQHKTSSHNGRSQPEAYTLRSDDHDCSKAL
jgi:isopenicillin N synthase-like dioxygenase